MLTAQFVTIVKNRAIISSSAACTLKPSGARRRISTRPHQPIISIISNKLDGHKITVSQDPNHNSSEWDARVMRLSTKYTKDQQYGNENDFEGLRDCLFKVKFERKLATTDFRPRRALSASILDALNKIVTERKNLLARNLPLQK